MQKSELRKIRALTATRQMMQKGKRFKEVTVTLPYSDSTYIRIDPDYDILLRVQNHGPYIKIALFLPEDMRKGIKSSRYEIFLNVVGEEFITRELDKDGKEVRWSNAMVHNLKDVPDFLYNSKDSVKVFCSNDGMRTLASLEITKDAWKQSRGIRRLYYWQQEQRDKETKRKEEREQAPWDDDMAMVGEVPKGFYEWMRKEACEENYIIYKYQRTGVTSGYCSRCKNTVAINKPKHGDKTRCPKCRTAAVFKSSGKISALYTKSYEAEIIQRIDGGIVIRKFRGWQNYRDREYTDPKVINSECERILVFETGFHKVYTWGSYKNKYTRWIPSSESSYWEYYYHRDVKLYRGNMKYLKRHTFLKYSAIDLWDKVPNSTAGYLRQEQQLPVIEKLARVGMFNLASEIIHDTTYDEQLEVFNNTETELHKMLGIDKARLKRLKAMDGGVHALWWLIFEKHNNTIWSDDMIKAFDDEEIDIDDIDFIEGLSVAKKYNYICKQAKLMAEGLYQTIATWRDYLYMAKKLKMDITQDLIRKPKNLKEAHDRLILMSKKDGIKAQAEKLVKKFPKVDANLEKLEKFEYEDGEYCIVTPKAIEDIVAEGIILGHCVHTCDYYFSRIQTDESYLFFLRKSCSPDMPWYTLEVEPSGNIRQKRTTGDKQNPDFDKALPFLKKWQKYYKKLLTNEEKELGKKADKLRRENYKKLREDGNKVWHGPLAGQLLADVLERDFMEAI